MKKILAAMAAATVLSAGTAMAAPINNMTGNETAIGAGTKES